MHYGPPTHFHMIPSITTKKQTKSTLVQPTHATNNPIICITMMCSIYATISDINEFENVCVGGGICAKWWRVRRPAVPPPQKQIHTHISYCQGTEITMTTRWFHIQNCGQQNEDIVPSQALRLHLFRAHAIVLMLVKSRIYLWTNEE